MAKPAQDKQDQQRLHLPDLDRGQTTSPTPGQPTRTSPEPKDSGAPTDDSPKRARKQSRQQARTEPASGTSEPENTVAVASRARRQPPPAPEGPETAAPAPTEPKTRTSGGARDTEIPRAVAERFLRVDNKYYFPDQTLAFVDRGSKLKAETNNAEVARSLVAIAEARGWTAITVTGTEQFRREIWREAQRRDIRVQGYVPGQVEQEALKRQQQRQGRGPDSTQPGSDTSSSPQATRDRAATGLLQAAGAAHYKFDPNQAMSYYVKVKTPDGERTLWGVDLERALAESRTRVQPGDEVVVQNLGARPVTLKVPVRDPAGKTVDHKLIETHRNQWLVEKPSYLAERAQAAAAVRNPQQTPADVARQHPGFRQAATGLWLGQQFAEQKLEQPEDRQRLLVRLRERIAQALEREASFRSFDLTPEAQRRQRWQPAQARRYPDREHDVPDHVRA